ncbi:MAG: hypothetical protein DMF89_04680 [Acidobacteria bacterium]|nr:MAG: hypothetical protein DMF89_04680 [Acidobacteriota bacterium]
MPDRPGRRTGSATAPFTIVIFPGASLMNIQPLTDGVTLVGCPGCGAVQIFVVGQPPFTAFVHEDDTCPILRRIQAAMAWLQAATRDPVEDN